MPLRGCCCLLRQTARRQGIAGCDRSRNHGWRKSAELNARHLAHRKLDQSPIVATYGVLQNQIAIYPTDSRRQPKVLAVASATESGRPAPCRPGFRVWEVDRLAERSSEPATLAAPEAKASNTVAALCCPSGKSPHAIPSIFRS